MIRGHVHFSSGRVHEAIEDYSVSRDQKLSVNINSDGVYHDFFFMYLNSIANRIKKI